MKPNSSRRNLLFTLLLGTLILFSPVPQNIQAQTASPALMQMAQGELAKRGLSEAEVRTRLMQKGIDVDNIPPAEYASYQTRVMAVLDELQAEKKAAATATPAVSTPISITVGGTNATPTGTAAGATTPTATNAVGTVATIEPAPVTTPEEAAAEASQRVLQAANARTTSNIYGHSIFTDNSLDVYRTTDGAQAPETYVLGAGDEVHITIFGASQTEIQQRITNEGYIQPTGAARIFLKGLSLAQARRVIKESLSSSYLFRADQLAVTIVTARTVLVNVYGETKISGGFTLSALNSALNALSAAGGVTNNGSVRTIQVIRGETKKTIDVYEFMNDPSVQFKFDLQNNDILFVPVAKKLVNIQGAVKRPMRYEMLDNENLTDLIKYAGGLTMDVYPDFLQIQRYVNGEEKLFEWNLADITSGKTKVSLVDGDVIRIKSINIPMDAYVDVEGSVYYPGRFDLKSNTLLSTLIANAKPNFQAKTDLLFVERTRPDNTIEVLTVPFPGYNGAPDFTIQGRDKVRVLDLTTYRDIATISVQGQVRTPFTRNFSLNDRLTIAQAIELAGGLKSSVYPIAYIRRINIMNPKEIKYLRIDLNQSTTDPLQPGDELTIYDKTTYTDVNEVSVQGAVRLPFRKSFANTDRLNAKQAIELAGGLKTSVYPVAYIFRRNLLNPVEMQYIRIELSQAEYVDLQPGDQLNIFDNTTYTNVGEVRISGAVKISGSYTYDPSLTLRALITNAGGFNVGAAYNRVEIFRTVLSPTEKPKLDLITLQVDTNFQLVKPTKFALQPYDQVVVRMTPEFTLGRTVELNGQVKYPGVYVLESKQTTLNDVIHMAGGLLKDADPYGAKLFRTYNNRGNITIQLKKVISSPNRLSNNPILFEGDVVNLGRLENTVSILETGTRMAQYSTNADGNTIKNIVFQGKRSAKWYIRNFAGGFQKNTDRNSVTVTYPNNQMQSTKRFLIVFNDYPTVQPGSIITMKMDPEKIEAELNPKEKIDWESTVAKGLSTLMSTLSIILLLQRL